MTIVIHKHKLAYLSSGWGVYCTDDACDFRLTYDHLLSVLEDVCQPAYVIGDVSAATAAREAAEAELSNGHKALTAAGVPERDDNGALSICGRVVRLKARAEAAEADAARLAEVAKGFCFTYQLAAQQMGDMEATPEMVDMLKAFHKMQAALAAHDAAAAKKGKSETDAKRDRYVEKLREISRDPNVAKRSEDLQRRVGALSPEKLLRPFDNVELRPHDAAAADGDSTHTCADCKLRSECIYTNGEGDYCKDWTGGNDTD